MEDKLLRRVSVKTGLNASTNSASAQRDLRFKRLCSKLTRIGKDSSDILGRYVVETFPSNEQTCSHLAQAGTLRASRDLAGRAWSESGSGWPK